MTGQAGGSSKSVYQNPELEAMAKEIQELLQERLALQREVQEQEYIISAKSTETHSLQVLLAQCTCCIRPVIGLWVRSLRKYEIGQCFRAHFLEVLLFRIEIFEVWPICSRGLYHFRKLSFFIKADMRGWSFF